VTYGDVGHEDSRHSHYSAVIILAVDMRPTTLYCAIRSADEGVVCTDLMAVCMMCGWVDESRACEWVVRRDEAMPSVHMIKILCGCAQVVISCMTEPEGSQPGEGIKTSGYALSVSIPFLFFVFQPSTTNIT
jgi:hypothetical protein